MSSIMDRVKFEDSSNIRSCLILNLKKQGFVLLKDDLETGSFVCSVNLLRIFADDLAKKLKRKLHFPTHSIETIWKFQLHSTFFLLKVSFQQTYLDQAMNDSAIPTKVAKLEKIQSIVNTFLAKDGHLEIFLIDNMKVGLKSHIYFFSKDLLKKIKELGIFFIGISELINIEFQNIKSSYSVNYETMLYEILPPKESQSQRNCYEIQESPQSSDQYNIHVFQILNQYNSEKQKNIEKIENIQAKIFLTTSNEQEDSKKITFKELVRKFVKSKANQQHQQNEAIKLLKNRRRLKQKNLAQFFLEKASSTHTQKDEDEVKITSNLFSPAYEETLLNYRQKRKKDFLKENYFIQFMNIYRQILDGVKHLSEKDTIHSDLKQQNIMLQKVCKSSSPGNVKIIDFGSAIFQAKAKHEKIKEKDFSEQQRKVQERKKQYLTPGFYNENIDHMDIYHKNFDIFALGKILHKFFVSSDCAQLRPCYSSFFQCINNTVIQCIIRPSDPRSLTIDKLISAARKVEKSYWRVKSETEGRLYDFR